MFEGLSFGEKIKIWQKIADTSFKKGEGLVFGAHLLLLLLLLLSLLLLLLLFKNYLGSVDWQININDPKFQGLHI